MVDAKIAALELKIRHFDINILFRPPKSPDTNFERIIYIISGDRFTHYSCRGLN